MVDQTSVWCGRGDRTVRSQGATWPASAPPMASSHFFHVQYKATARPHAKRKEGKTKRKARDACLLSCFLLVIRNAKRNTCSAAAGFHEPPSNGPERSDLNLLCPLHTDSRKGRL